MRLTDSNDVISCSLVLAKSRVTPAKTVKIPRLELTAAVTSVLVGTFLNKELTYSNVTNFYWTDSKVVLGYIANNTRRFHVFVANRVQQIIESTTVDQWNHDGTRENPADLASRGMTSQEMLDSTLWWKGPSFLSSADPLPHSEIDVQLADGDPEVKVATVHTATTSVKTFNNLIARLSYFFSDW